MNNSKGVQLLLDDTEAKEIKSFLQQKHPALSFTIQASTDHLKGKRGVLDILTLIWYDPVASKVLGSVFFDLIKYLFTKKTIHYERVPSSKELKIELSDNITIIKITSELDFNESLKIRLEHESGNIKAITLKKVKQK